jgi:hypothetical protein
MNAAVVDSANQSLGQLSTSPRLAPTLRLPAQVKAAMVDSAHQSVAQLKSELAEATADAEDSRAAADAAEHRLIKVGWGAAGGGGAWSLHSRPEEEASSWAVQPATRQQQPPLPPPIPGRSCKRPQPMRPQRCAPTWTQRAPR